MKIFLNYIHYNIAKTEVGWIHQKEILAHFIVLKSWKGKMANLWPWTSWWLWKLQHSSRHHTLEVYNLGFHPKKEFLEKGSLTSEKIRKTEKYVWRLEHNKSALKPFFDGFNQLQKDVNFFFVYQMSKYCGENETSTI